MGTNSSIKNILILHPSFKGIGGVSVFVNRLNKLLIDKQIKTKAISFAFYLKNLNLKFKDSLSLVQISNPLYALLVIVLLFVSRKKIYSIYHFDILRYRNFKLLSIKLCCRLSNKNIFINDNSYNWAKKNKVNNFVKHSIFIPPIYNSTHSNNNENIFCTNAYALTHDKDGKEIYGVLTLIDVFKDINNSKLIISDSNNSYGNYFVENNIKLPKNVILKSYEHDFMDTLYESNVFIRFTSTDGDSLSINEALCLNKLVIASDVVSRPESDNLILIKHNTVELKEAIEKIISKNIICATDNEFKNRINNNLNNFLCELS
jgi:hypothetical protein